MLYEINLEILVIMNDNNLHTIVCRSLDKDVDALSASIQSRLTQSRTGALEKSLEPSSYFPFNFIKQPVNVAAVFASLLLVTLSFVVVLNVNEDIGLEVADSNLMPYEPIEENIVNDDVGKDFFLTEEDLDFFENLDLYQWLDSEFKIS